MLTLTTNGCTVSRARVYTLLQCFLLGESAIVAGGKKGTNGGKVTFFQVNRRSVLLLAAPAANIDSGRYQCQQRTLLT